MGKRIGMGGLIGGDRAGKKNGMLASTRTELGKGYKRKKKGEKLGSKG